jgi:hypothetical protein
MIFFVKGKNDIKQFNILHMKFEASNSLMLTSTICYCQVDRCMLGGRCTIFM